MVAWYQRLPQSVRELLFQVVLHILVFVFYSFDRYEPKIAAHQYAFFLSYAAFAGYVNYWLLPRYFYRKKYLGFFIWICVTLACLIFVEEWLLEPWFFTGRRAEHFPGVFYTLVDVLPVMTILVGFKFGWDALIKQREVEELRATMQESELQFLKSQINPHFLFNNLNNLYSYALEQSPKTPTIILELSSVLRYMLYECREKYVALDKEIEHLHDFTRLNELQIEDRGKVNFKMEPITPGYLIAPLILIVFIENAFKHSQSGQSDQIRIDIAIRVTPGGALYFTSGNNFQPTSANSVTHGIGLSNVQKRLELLYPDAHQLEIIQDGNWFEVRLFMQLHKYA